ncbi:MAG: phosphoribosyltransferase [Bacteroidia bacterium]|nr:phosphoribosyltransferase [Bacteroidia bacterium]
MNSGRTIILSQPEIAAKLKRMTFEIYEQNFGEEEIILIGIEFRGGYLAEKTRELLSLVAPFRVYIYPSVIDREKTSGMMEIIGPGGLPSLTGKTVIVIDDVLYSGRTLLSVVAQLLPLSPKRIQTMVLIDRGHRQMPVSPDYVGMELATTLQQHVSFEIQADGNALAYLS